MGEPKKQLKPASLSAAKRMGVLVGAAPFIKKRGYIGGTPAQARKTYWGTDNEMYMLTDSVARTYGISPELLRARMDREGYTDTRIKELNEDYRNKTNNALLGEQLFKSKAMPYAAGNEFGLDDAGTYIKDGKVKLINENWSDGDFTNEKGRITNIAMGDKYSDNIGIMAATLKAMRDQAKKDFPKASDEDLDRYARAYYNRGFAGGKKYVKSGGKGYNVKTKFENGGKTMSKPKRSLEHRGNYDILTDAIQVYKPDTTTIEYPNLIYSNTNPLYGLFGSGIGYNMHGQLVDYNDGGKPITEEQAKQKAKQYYVNPRERASDAAKVVLMDMALDRFRDNKKYKEGGSIHIDPSKRGTFTAAATKHGMGVQEFASRVLRNKEDFSAAMVKKANFARNASKWKH